MWTPPGSATQANPGTGQSALPTVAIARESLACMAAPAGVARLAVAPERLALERPTSSEARLRATASTAAGKPKSVCPVEALRLQRWYRELPSIARYCPLPSASLHGERAFSHSTYKMSLETVRLHLWVFPFCSPVVAS